MKKSIITAATALAVAVTPAFALTYTVQTAGTGPYMAWTAFVTADPSTAVVATADIARTNLPGAVQPPHAISYLAILAGNGSTLPNGSATVAGNDATRFGFLWGSPDYDNLVTFHTSTGDETFSGADLCARIDCPYPAQNRGFAVELWAHGVADQTIASVTFGFSGPTAHGFEVAAIPEPSTYALMFAGLLGLGCVARRRHRATL